MTDVKISALTNKPTPTSADYIVIVDNEVSPATTKRAPYPTLTPSSDTNTKPCLLVGFDATADYVCDGTDDHMQIQAAIDALAALNGGLVFIKAGNYNAATITLKDKVSLAGEGRKSHIKGKTNAAPNIIISENFSSAAGSGNSFAGIAHGFIDNLSFEGGTQTASGAGSTTYRSMNAVIKLYAWDFRLSNIRIDYAPELAIYTEHDNDWNDDGTFNTYEFGENTYTNIRCKNYGIAGWVNRGSHDSYLNNIYISSSIDTGFMPDYGYIQQTDGTNHYGSNGAVAHGLHVWGNHTYNAVLLDNSNIIDGFIYAEGCNGSAIYLRNSSANRFKAFLGYAGLVAGHGVELQGTSNGNDIEAVVESNVDGALFKINDSGSNNILKQGPGYGSPSGAVFDISSGGSYSGNHNQFILWPAYTGSTFNGTPDILDFVDGPDTTLPIKRVHIRAKNTSGGTLAAGSVVVFKSVANGDEVTTTTTAGDKKVVGVVAESIANNAYGYILVEGKTVLLKVDGTTDIAIGDYLSCFTTVKIAKKASTGEMAFAIALEAYATDDSNGVLDAVLIKPRLI